jgi:hypothetical protein
VAQQVDCEGLRPAVCSVSVCLSFSLSLSAYLPSPSLCLYTCLSLSRHQRGMKAAEGMRGKSRRAVGVDPVLGVFCRQPWRRGPAREMTQNASFSLRMDMNAR